MAYSTRPQTTAASGLGRRQLPHPHAVAFAVEGDLDVVVVDQAALLHEVVVPEVRPLHEPPIIDASTLMVRSTFGRQFQMSSSAVNVAVPASRAGARIRMSEWSSPYDPGSIVSDRDQRSLAISVVIWP